MKRNKAWTKEKTKEYHEEYRLKNKENIKEYHEEYRLKNKEKKLKQNKEFRQQNPEYMKEYRLKNKESLKEYSKEYNLKNREQIKEIKREWYLKNREYLKEYNEKHKKRRNKYERERRRTDPIYRMQCNMRTAMSNALSGRRKSKPTMDIIGCSVEGFFQHLENCEKWESWMTRESYGSKWDVDHIVAISRWNHNCPLQFALCWNKSNLQPMEHIANIKKGAR